MPKNFPCLPIDSSSPRCCTPLAWNVQIYIGNRELLFIFQTPSGLILKEVRYRKGDYSKLPMKINRQLPKAQTEGAVPVARGVQTCRSGGGLHSHGVTDEKLLVWY